MYSIRLETPGSSSIPDGLVGAAAVVDHPYTPFGVDSFPSKPGDVGFVGNVVEVFCKRLCLLDSRFSAWLLESEHHSRCLSGFLDHSKFHP